MPTLEQLRDHIISVVQDDSFSAELIDGLINEATETIASRIRFSKLKTSDTVTTSISSAMVAAPADFLSGLFKVELVGKKPPTVVTTFGQMLDRYPTIESDPDEGDVATVYASEGEVWYSPIPITPTEMTLHYFRRPVPMVKDGDIPEIIPSHMQRRAIGSYVLAELYDQLEDGMDGAKVNTKSYRSKFEGMIEEIEIYVGGQERPAPPRDRKRMI